MVKGYFMKNSLLKIISLATVLAVIFACVCTSFATSKKGDINSDGNVNSEDALSVVKYVVGYPSDYTADELDIDKDGNVTSSDALVILQIAVGIINPEETTESTSDTTTETTTEETTTENAVTPPSNKSEIIAAYNNAVNKAVSEKAGYKKTRTAVLGKLEGAESLMKMSVVKEAINGFLGIGESTYTNTKGSAKHLMSASIKESDVTATKVEKVDGNIYRITLNLADGRSTAPTVSDTSPVIRSGVLFGTDYTSTDYDYKSASNICKGINATGEATVKSVTQDTKNTVATAEIDIATGKLVNLSISWTWQAKLTDIKYGFIKVSGTGNADTTVEYKDFVW